MQEDTSMWECQTHVISSGWRQELSSFMLWQELSSNQMCTYVASEASSDQINSYAASEKTSNATV